MSRLSLYGDTPLALSIIISLWMAGCSDPASCPPGSTPAGGRCIAADASASDGGTTGLDAAAETAEDAGAVDGAAPHFEIAADSSVVTVRQDATRSVTLEVEPANGFDAPVTVDTSGLPGGVSATAPELSPSSPGEITFEATAAAPHGGPHVIRVTGSSDGLSHELELALYVAGEAGDSDQSFGSGGSVEHDLEPDRDTERLNAVVVHGDGLVAAGRAEHSSDDDSSSISLAARLRGDGQLDETFGSDGILVNDLGGTESAYLDAAAHAEGQLMLGGYRRSGGERVSVIAQHGADGVRASDFGRGGLVELPSGGPYPVLSLRGDRFLVGNASPLSIYRMNGETVDSFGGEGTVSNLLGWEWSSFNIGQPFASLDGDHRAVLTQDGEGGFRVLRLTPEGARDEDYGADMGVATATVVDPDALTFVRSSITGEEGRVLVAVDVAVPEGDGPGYSVVACMSETGDLDPSFGDDGTLELKHDTDNVSVFSLVRAREGRLLVVHGSADGGEDLQAERITRFSIGGDVDPTFGADGSIPIEVPNFAAAVVDHRAGRVYQVGHDPAEGGIVVNRHWL